jgi:hypothetical protein
MLNVLAMLTTLINVHHMHIVGYTMSCIGCVVIVGVAIYLLTLQLNLHVFDRCRLCR